MHKGKNSGILTYHTILVFVRVIEANRQGVVSAPLVVQATKKGLAGRDLGKRVRWVLFQGRAKCSKSICFSSNAACSHLHKK